jgi:hypothetical protein
MSGALIILSSSRLSQRRVVLLEFFSFKKEVPPAFYSKRHHEVQFQFELATLPTRSNLLHALIASEFRDIGKATTLTQNDSSSVPKASPLLLHQNDLCLLAPIS